MKTRLQELRKKAGYKSAKAFAAECGIAIGTYTDYEQGRTKLTLERAWQIADVLDISLDELAGRDYQPESIYPDPRQAELNECWSIADDAQRSVILGVAKLGAGRPDVAEASPGMDGDARRAV